MKTAQGTSVRRNRIDIRPVSPKRVHFQSPAVVEDSSPERTKDTAAASPEPEATVQTRYGRIIKPVEQLDL